MVSIPSPGLSKWWETCGFYLSALVQHTPHSIASCLVLLTVQRKSLILLANQANVALLHSTAILSLVCVIAQMTRTYKFPGTSRKHRVATVRHEALGGLLRFRCTRWNLNEIIWVRASSIWKYPPAGDGVCVWVASWLAVTAPRWDLRFPQYYISISYFKVGRDTRGSINFLTTSGGVTSWWTTWSNSSLCK